MIARLVVSLTAALFACAPTAVAEPPAPPSPIVPPPVQPANIGDLKTEATQYYDSGSYLIDLQLAAWPAIPWINEEAARVDRPAVVFDIDETALPNWEAIKANDFGRVIGGPCNALPQGPCGWQAWDLTAQSTVIRPTMDVYNTAKGRGAAIFFITGRPESQREATERQPHRGRLHRLHRADHGTGCCAVCFGRRLQGAATTGDRASKATPSSPTWATSRRTSMAGCPSAPSCCRTRSIAFRDGSAHELLGQLLQRLARVALPQLAEYRQ